MKLNCLKSESLDRIVSPCSLGGCPYIEIVRRFEPCISNVKSVRIEIDQYRLEARREVLVEQQPHSIGKDTNRRSRSAANDKQARMSDSSSSGKSASI